MRGVWRHRQASRVHPETRYAKGGDLAGETNRQCVADFAAAALRAALGPALAQGPPRFAPARYHAPVTTTQIVFS